MKAIQIVSFDVPTPPDYGGVIDVYYKIRALHSAGVKVYLHCFTDGRRPDETLNALCEHVYLYPRKKSRWLLFSRIPFIVRSRQNSKLLHQVKEGPPVVLLEGVHCTALLWEKALANHRMILRMHNLESRYYRELAGSSTSAVKSIYYRMEAWKLRRYEQKLLRCDVPTLHINREEMKQWPVSRALWLPPWHGQIQVSGKGGDYVLYHGNLSVEENDRAVRWLLRNVQPLTPCIPWVIAGKQPPREVIRLCNEANGVQLYSDPDAKTMEELIRNAAVHALMTFQATGIKLKLLYALFSPGQVVVNPAMVAGTGLEHAVIVAREANAFAGAIKQVIAGEIKEKHIPEIHRDGPKTEKLIQFVESLPGSGRFRNA